jgi:hypothetical protein
MYDQIKANLPAVDFDNCIFLTKTAPVCPPMIRSGGGMARSVSGGLGGVLLYIGHSFLIAVAIATMNWGAEAIADALHAALFGS